MTVVISNVLAPAFAILGYSLLLIAIGFGPAARLLSRDRPPMAILIAPVIGISLVTITHYILLYYLLLPHEPLLVNLGLLLVSLAACLTVTGGGIRWHPGVRGLRPPLVRWGRFAIVPVLAILCFCALFTRSGLEMLSAGQDELAYASITEQIMRHMHRGTELDLPVPRADHLVVDLVPVELAYRADQRLGVSYLLADLAWFSGISPEQAFPLLVGVFIAMTTLALGSLERILFSGSRAGVLAAQFVFAATGMLIMLHFQGSLSNVGSLGLRLAGLALIAWAVGVSRATGPLVLATLVAAAWLVLYYESVVFGLVLPILAIVLVAALRAVLAGERAFLVVGGRAITMLATAAIAMPFLSSATIRSHGLMIAHLWCLLSVACLAVQPMAGTPLAVVVDRITDSFSRNVPVNLGVVSLHDLSSANYWLWVYFHKHAPWVFVTLGLIAILGFGRARPPMGLAYAVATAASLVAAMLGAATGNNLFAVRGIQFSTSLMLLGLTCFAFASGTRFASRVRTAALDGSRAAAAILLTGLLVFNAFTQYRVVRYVNSHTFETDPIIHRFNPEAPVWQRLREAVSTPDDAPVLISGFRDTSTPYWLALGIRPAAHFLGDSILAFWPIVPSLEDWASSVDQYFTRYDNTTLRNRLLNSPLNDWPRTYSDFLARSVRAIVPIGGGYPVEWGAQPSPAGPRTLRFLNMADVIERTGTSVILDPGTVSPAEADEQGPWWPSDLPIRFHPAVAGLGNGVIEVRYTGLAPTVDVMNAPGELVHSGATIRGQSVIRLGGSVDPVTTVTVTLGPATRLRLITFVRL